MKTLYRLPRTVTRALGLLAAAAIAAAALLAFPTVTYAQGEGPAAPPAGTPREPGPFALVRIEMNLSCQADRLYLSGRAVDRTEAWIEALQKQGIDTADLESALADFSAALAEAQGYHDEAQRIFDARAGFDEDGRVTDPEAARETIRGTLENLREANYVLSGATLELRLAIHEFRGVLRAEREA
ncbi:MAG: hypothetical protein Kow00124_23580 [Anaerolineae bacterium]